MAIRNLTKKSVAYLMIGLMAMLIANKAMFTHFHKNADGTFILHAHLYDRSNDSKPYKSHHHTKDELLFLQNLEILFLFVLLTSALLRFYRKAIYLTREISNNTQTCIILHKGRAPPIL
ncbi:hypothetical protein ES705_11931 [subsurface metagenome]